MNVTDIIRQAATRYGQDPEAALREAQIESSGNPNAVNPRSHAAGLFQFIPSTWRQYGQGSPLDPAANADAAMRFARDNALQFRAVFGRDPTPGEAYLMHQQGAGGAIKLLQNPNAPAAGIVGAPAIVQNGGQPGMSAGQFANMWSSKFGSGAPASRSPAGAPAMAGADRRGLDAPAAPAPNLAAMFAGALQPQQPGVYQYDPEALNAV